MATFRIHEDLEKENRDAKIPTGPLKGHEANKDKNKRTLSVLSVINSKQIVGRETVAGGKQVRNQTHNLTKHFFLFPVHHNGLGSSPIVFRCFSFVFPK